MIWIIKTNTNTCQLYEYSKKPQRVTLIKEILHLENKLKNSVNLTSERPGKYHKGDGARSAYSPPTDPKEVEIIHFAKEIAALLEKGRVDHLYNQLIIIAEPRMFGVLAEELNPHIKNLVINNIQKDLQNMSEKSFLEFLKSNTLYPMT